MDPFSSCCQLSGFLAIWPLISISRRRHLFANRSKNKSSVHYRRRRAAC